MADEKSNVEASATKAVSELFDKEKLSQFVESSVKMIAQGKPTIDGRKNLAAAHFYETDNGKIGTFAMWMKGTPFKIYIGTEAEINEMQTDFYKVASESGFGVKLTPKQRAEKRKKLRKKMKRK